MKAWLLRAAFAFPLLLVLALIVKVTLIEPYKITLIEFDIGPMKKGDREI